MTLSELVSRLGAATFPIISLIVFLIIFVAIAYRTLRPSVREELRRAGSMPLDDEGARDE